MGFRLISTLPEDQQKGRTKLWCLDMATKDLTYCRDFMEDGSFSPTTIIHSTWNDVSGIEDDIEHSDVEDGVVEDVGAPGNSGPSNSGPSRPRSSNPGPGSPSSTRGKSRKPKTTSGTKRKRQAEATGSRKTKQSRTADAE